MTDTGRGVTKEETDVPYIYISFAQFIPIYAGSPQLVSGHTYTLQIERRIYSSNHFIRNTNYNIVYVLLINHTHHNTYSS